MIAEAAAAGRQLRWQIGSDGTQLRDCSVEFGKFLIEFRQFGLSSVAFPLGSDAPP